MRPYVHELRHHLLTATLIGSIVVLGLVGVAGGANSSHTGLGGFELAYTYAGGYHFVLYAYTSQGQASIGTPAQMWINSSSTPAYPLAYVDATTNAAGLAILGADIPAGTYPIDFTVGSSSGSIGEATDLANVSSGAIATGASFEAVSLGTWATTRAVSVTGVTGTGAVPKGYEVRYWLDQNSTFPGTGPVPENATTLLGTLNGYQANLAWTAALASPATSWVEFEMFASNGSAVAASVLPADTLLTTGVSPAGTTAISFLSSVQPLVALIGLVLAYARYGKDRSQGYLESVLWRPVTPEGLFLVRLASIVLALGIGIGLMLGALDGWLTVALGSGLPLAAILPLAAVLLAEGVAFAGFILFASHLFRTRGALIGVALGSFVFFSVLFAILLTSISPDFPTLSANAVTLGASYANPMELLGPAFGALVPSSPSNPVVPVGAIGLYAPVGATNIALLIGVTITWSVAPTGAAFVLAHVRD